MPKNIQIDGNKITDWDSFHDQFSETLGFPRFYGRNMDAWNDCMTSLDAPEVGLSSVYHALLECSAFVNWRRIEKGAPAILALSFYS